MIAQEKEIAEIELHMDQAQKMIDKADAYMRLRNNPDYKTVIEVGYFEENAVRLVSLKAAGPMQTDEKQAAVLKAIDAIGELQQYLQGLLVLAGQAESAINDSREEIAMLEQEGAE